MNFERNPKFFKWWLQSYLVDTQKIVVGLRNDQGVVNQIVECRTNEMYHAVTKRSNDRLRNDRFTKRIISCVIGSLARSIQVKYFLRILLK